VSAIIEFNTFPWEVLGQYVRQKKVVIEDRVLRLLELTDGFAEADWCCRAHDGYVVTGELQLTFSERSTVLGPGSGLHLDGCPSDRHKASVIHGPVLLFLVEPVAG
jgi:hypothetical protein